MPMNKNTMKQQNGTCTSFTIINKQNKQKLTIKKLACFE